ncbi:phenylalanine--tRNA ligase subunit beta [Thermoactinomyces sp. DSM 45892]|uniref:phenylalanine--tRNA ligase subunit beta n=1 Tax=Thermoactinomyces sp. DSM 45892 TaxID=1882753 RepID=UPI0008994E44|nr:phenylalanine--tRNA ligase subunit beta [Thermoactinomyces sp. DSM 45892]SDZ18278.1 phenylalanyl-tRNA synthetase beta subunit [Thermoactinomyces sp. DSM 45892]
MLVSYDWISEYVDLTGITPEMIAEELNRTGIEVEVIYTRDNGVSHVVVGHVLSVEKHPEADKLNITQVDVGDSEPLQIVCGAPNVAAGQLVPVAVKGATLPGGIKIKDTKLRGVASRGMICSAKELGIPDKFLMEHQKQGILVLGTDAVIGQDIKEYLGMDDQVVELELTPNRSDCLSMMGVAYELSAIFNRELRFPERKEAILSTENTQIEITTDLEEDCPFYAVQVVKGIQVGPSPQWLQNRLISAGIRPINNVVDVTNYVMIETGQPLHAFDLQTIPTGEIVVRRSRAGETVVTLDGVTRALDDETLLITDGAQTLGLAGVMGGESSEVRPHTTTVLLESAYFDPTLIRRASRKLGLRSEASNRFEKGVDPERILPALNCAVQLLQEVAGAQVGSGVIVKRSGEIEEVTVSLRHDRLMKVLGTSISEEQVIEIFRRLGFASHFDAEKKTHHVQVPTRRPDIQLEVDLIEEVARIYGYNRIPTTLPWGQQQPGHLSDSQRLRRKLRHLLIDLGLSEVLTYSLTSSKRGTEVGALTPSVGPVRLAMPMSSEHAVLRTTLLPELVQTAAYNVKHGNEDLAIFEMGRVYVTQEKKLTELPEERMELAFLLTGDLRSARWNRQAMHGGDFYVAKGIVQAIIERIGVSNVEIQAASHHEGFHPGRTAELVYNGEVMGVLGQMHPQLAKQHDLKETVIVQLDLDRLQQAIQKDVRYQAIPRFPAVTRDLALVVDKNVEAGVLEAGIHEVAGELLESVRLFDVFIGSQVGEGKMSIAYSLVYRATDRTLTDAEVSATHLKVVEHLQTTLGAVLRS